MSRKLNLTKTEAIDLLEDLLEFMEQDETIEISLQSGKRYVLTVPDEVLNAYEDDI